jgi:hypothetical protein
MKKLIALVFLTSTLTGCGSTGNTGITCDTPEVKQVEANMFGGNEKGMRVDSVTQFTNKQTGAISCRVSISFDKDGKRETLWGDDFTFALDVADDGKNFTVKLTGVPKGYEHVFR